jgi:quinol monooxygenase YgiN
MKCRAIWTAVALALLAAMAAAQAQEQYLDVYAVQVKPDKRAEFDAVTKKIVAANRQNKGDTWLTMETVYGQGSRVTFISTRRSYEEAEKAAETFDGAIEKALGKPGTEKLFQDYNQCVVNYRSEFRRRRWDLSSNAPADDAAMAKLLGESRWLRTVAVHVRPGQADAFEALLKDLKTAREKASPPITTLVSQAVAGQEGTVFYVTTPESSLAGFDTLPSMQKLLGDDGYAKYVKTNTDAVANTETVINHFLPELSNPPEELVAVAPDYWRPKTAMAAKSASKKNGMVNAASTSKEEDKSQQH